MPYEGEFASYRPIHRLTESKRVQKLLARMKKKYSSDDNDTLPTIEISDLSPSEWQPNLVLAIDGSHQEEPVENGYPGAEVGYVTVAAVLMDVAKIKKLDIQRPADPKLFRETEKVQSIDSAFPGCNIVIDSEKSPKNSLRKTLFETLKEIQLFSDGESILETYEVLLEYKSKDGKQNCPYAEDCGDTEGKYLSKKKIYSCQCPYEEVLYSTDALRIHEGMVPDSVNGAMFAEIMQVLEHIVVIHILRWFEKKGLLWLLGDMGIVIDGPLRVHGYPAWLSSAISHELNRINTAAKEFTEDQDLLMIGIEKSGYFVNHFERIDQDKQGTQGVFPLQTVGLLTDEYIKKNIIFSDSTKPYGLDTYFGRKFFYKTASGARIVASLPILDKSHGDLTYAVPEQYPRLFDALGLIDQLVSSRYQNSLSPLISAHAEAAIPMNLGARVLEDMAKELIAEKHR